MDKNIKSFSAFAAFVIITTLMGYPLGLFRLLLFPLYAIGFWVFGRNPLAWCFPLWLRLMQRVCYQTMNVGWKYSGNWLHGSAADTAEVSRRLKQPGLKVVIANHPCNYFTIVPLLGALHLIGPRLVVVLKHSHLFSPHGFGLWGIHSGVFINRLFRLPGFGWLRSASYTMLRYQLSKLCQAAVKTKQPITLVVMPDQRWTTKRWQVAGARRHQSIMRPQSGALYEIIEASQGLDVEYIDMTIAVDRAPTAIEGWFAFTGLVGADVWINSQLVTDEVQALEPGRFNLQRWLEQRYQRKNRLYAQWLEEGGHRP